MGPLLMRAFLQIRSERGSAIVIGVQQHKDRHHSSAPASSELHMPLQLAGLDDRTTAYSDRLWNIDQSTRIDLGDHPTYEDRECSYLTMAFDHSGQDQAGHEPKRLI